MASMKDTNPFKGKERVKFNDKQHFFFGNKGTVIEVDNNSVYVKFDSGTTVFTSYKNLKKLKLKKKS